MRAERVRWLQVSTLFVWVCPRCTPPVFLGYFQVCFSELTWCSLISVMAPASYCCREQDASVDAMSVYGVKLLLRSRRSHRPLYPVFRQEHMLTIWNVREFALCPFFPRHPIVYLIFYRTAIFRPCIRHSSEPCRMFPRNGCA